METPQMMASTYSSTSLPLNQAVLAAQRHAMGQAGLAPPPQDFMNQFRNAQQAVPQEKKEKIMANTRRLIQVFIADPNENVPLDQCLLYTGEQKLTDLTDQELFFEVDIKAMLDKHNAERTKMINKAVKERTEYLEPVRIRDLKMTVVTIAQF